MDDYELLLGVSNTANQHSLSLFLAAIILCIITKLVLLRLFTLPVQQKDAISKSENKADKLLAKMITSQEKVYLTLSLVMLSTQIFIALKGLEILHFYFKGTLNHSIVTTIAFILLSFILLMSCKFIPRLLSSKLSAEQLRPFAYIIRTFEIILTPLTFIPLALSKRFISNQESENVDVAAEELPKIISDNIEINSEEENRIYSGILRFVATEAADIMTPRVDIEALNLSYDFKKVKEIITKSGFSRFPVYEGDPDNIKGILYVKDIISHIDVDNFQWQSTLRDPYYVQENMMINDLLLQFQARRGHLAIVVDEYGSVEGVISLEDVLEEIVGEISDESDKTDLLYTKITDNQYIFNGKTHISDFLRIFDLPEDYFDEFRGDAETLAGVMLEVKSDFLLVGDKQILGDFEFTVTSISSRRIEKIKIVKLI